MNSFSTGSDLLDFCHSSKDTQYESSTASGHGYCSQGNHTPQLYEYLPDEVDVASSIFVSHDMSVRYLDEV